jgi:site-specific DNA-methyltransferase (adenine-specific)/modification methylase
MNSDTLSKPSSIKPMKLSGIKPNPTNPRIIKDDKFQKLVTSIKEFPEMLEARPIVVNPDMIVLGGNMRLKAAKAAGLTEAPVYVATWEESKAKEFIVKDNVGFGEWDWDILANEWDATQLEEWGLDVWVPEPEEVEGLTDPDEVPSVPEEPKTKLGDLYILGEHRLLCGDSTKAEDVEKLMNGERADALITDPPYGIGIASNPVRQKYEKKNWDAVAIDPSRFLDMVDFAIIWGGNYFDLPPQKGFFVWDKKQPENFTLAMCEQAWTNIDTPAKMYRLSVTSYAKEHPTQKPVELLEWCIEKTTGVILDPFLGSGSTLIGAEKTGRKCYGMELDPRYCDVIVKRWEDFTGKKAELWKQ